MIRTAILLGLTLIGAVAWSWLYGPSLEPQQSELLSHLVTIWAGFTAYTYLAGVLTGNHSQVDRLWSTVPIVYAVYAAWFTGWDPRATLMAGLVGLWGARLTFNFARRGGYSWLPWKGEEDYRWEVLRKIAPLNRPVVWQIFHLLFICVYQMGLILLFTLPIAYAWRPSGGTSVLTTIDALLALAMIALIALEFVADQQQWNFQREKHRRIAAGEDLGPVYGKGFVHTGLWGRSRHPNYACEQSIWVVFYLFTGVATGEWLNASIVGCILLVLLFHGSANFSEGISAGKYPDYADYIKRVRRFI